MLRVSHYNLKDVLYRDLVATNKALGDLISSGKLNLDVPRVEIRERGERQRFLVSPGWIDAGIPSYSGVRIYADGLGQTDEDQVVILYDRRGLPVDIVVSKWVSAFRAAMLAMLSLRCWSRECVNLALVEGLGRIGFAASYLLLSCYDHLRLAIVDRKSSTFDMYWAELMEHFEPDRLVRIASRNDIVQLSPPPSVVVSATNRSDVAEALPGYDMIAEPILALHLGAKYDGAWDLGPLTRGKPSTVLVDSMGEFIRKKKRLTFKVDKALTLAQVARGEASLEGNVRYLSLGATGADVVLAKLLL